MKGPIDVQREINLTEILARCQEIKRAIVLPSGENETDSHHAFSLALIGLDICKKYQLKLDAEKVAAYALVHDLLEIVTGDEPTLMLDEDGLAAKYERERIAEEEFKMILQDYPDVLELYDAYERLDTVEAATVFTLDKTCTIWAHFHNKGRVLRDSGILAKVDIETWYARTKYKLKTRLKVQPPNEIRQLFDDSFQKMRREIVEEKGAA